MRESLQDTAPIDAEYEYTQASTVQNETDPIKMHDKVFGEPLSVQHAKCRWIWQYQSMSAKHKYVSLETYGRSNTNKSS